MDTGLSGVERRHDLDFRKQSAASEFLIPAPKLFDSIANHRVCGFRIHTSH